MRISTKGKYKNEKQILELKNTIIELQILLQKFNRKLAEVEKRISEHKERLFAMIMFEKQKIKRMKKK